MRRACARRLCTIAVSLWLAGLAAAGGRPARRPGQFRVWGSAGPELPPEPKGWREVRGGPDGVTPVAAAEEERRRGYVLFAREPLMPVSPYALPYPAERARELKAFAARGEYEPLALLIHALEPLADVALEASDLRSAKDGFIPVDHLDVRVARSIRVADDPKARTYRLTPFVLERRKTFAVPQGRTRRVWLTVRVPDGAEPGDYRGTLTVRPAGREAASVRLSVKVLPFALPPAPVEMALFFPRPPASDALLLQELTDLREHGLNAVEPALSVTIASRDREFGADDVAATRAHCTRMMRAIEQVFGKRRRPVTLEAGHQIAFYWDKAKSWFAFWPHSPAIEADLFKAIDLVRDLAKAEGWPPLRIYAQDEAGAHNLLDEAVYYYGLMKRRYPEMATWTDIGGGIAMGTDEIGPLSPIIDFLSTNRFTPDIARRLAARGKPYGIYNGAGPTPAGARFFFGFWGWKTGAAEIAQWVYHFGDNALRGRGLRQGDEGYVYLADDGPLPSLASEAVREGIDDYRYVHLLRQWIAAAKAGGAAEAARQAEEALRDLMGEIGWGFQALHGSERMPPPHPSTLRKWRWRVAGQILALQRAVGRPPKTMPSPPPPSPFDLPWAEARQETVTYGTELLPPSGFEAGQGPWQVQAWNGKGKGAVVAGEGHGGKRSVRIDNPAGSGSKAVTVLVWPSWGQGGLKLVLGGGRIYELAAWAKWQGRGTPPSLRIALPPGAAKSTREGSGKPGPDGWQRLWVRVETSFPATPKYLAAWVQGEGTVWVDDLSLRDVIPPPASLALDQAEYDAQDKVGVATLAVARHVTPARVRLTLSRIGGEAVTRLAAPFAPRVRVAEAGPRGEALLVAPATLRHCDFVFNPSALAPGRYEVEAELLDAQGTVLATCSAACHRTGEPE